MGAVEPNDMNTANWIPDGQLEASSVCKQLKGKLLLLARND